MIFLVAASVAEAQVSQAGSAVLVPQDLQEPYERLGRNPGNLDLLYSLAEQAADRGDATGGGGENYYRFAIRLLERGKLLAPRETQFDLLLGRVHYTLGNYIEADAYFETAVADPDLPDDVRVAAEDYLAAIGQETSPSSFIGSVTAGIRYQSNAVAGAEESLDALNSGAVTEEDDWDAFVQFSLLHTYDPGWASGTTYDTLFILDASRQFELTEYSSFGLSLRTGPRLNFGVERGGTMSIWPQLILGGIGLDDRFAGTEIGLGLETDYQMNRSTRIFWDIAAIERDYDPQPPFNDFELDGVEYTTLFGIAYTASDVLSYSAEILLGRVDATDPEDKSESVGLILGAQIRHAAPFGLTEADWIADLTLGYERRRYDKIADVPRRTDKPFSAEALWIIPVAPATSLLAGIGYTKRSTSPGWRGIVDYDNWDGYLAVDYRF